MCYHVEINISRAQEMPWIGCGFEKSPAKKEEEIEKQNFTESSLWYEESLHYELPSMLSPLAGETFKG